MFLTILKFAFRSFRRHIGYTMLSLASLSLGLGCSVLMLLFAWHEFGYDEFHAKKDRLYRMVTAVDGASYSAIAKVTGPWGLVARNDVPGVEDMTRFVFVGSLLFQNGDQRSYEPDGLYADSSVFRMFSFTLIAGDPNRALTEPNTMVLTRSLAQKYFGSVDILGKVLTLNGSIPTRITGVIEDVPEQSHMTFSYLRSMSSLTHPDKDNWIRWNQFYTYLLLRPGVEPAEIERSMPGVLKHYMGHQGTIYHPFLQPVTSIHLHSHLFREMFPNSDLTFVGIMSAIGLFLLALGCVNFVNFATARATQRSREVGVRKVTGATRSDLIQHFLGESFVLTAIAMGCAVVFVELMLPAFNELAQRHIESDWLGHPELLLMIGCLAVVVAISAGAFPAFVLSSFRPAEVLQSGWRGARGSRVRRALVIMQFSLSVFFLAATGIVYQQLEYIHGKQFGFTPDRLVIVPIQDRMLANRSETIKARLRAIPAIINASVTANLPGGSDYGIPSEPVGVPQEARPPLRILAGDADLLATLDVELAAGRYYSSQNASDSTSAFIINEEAARQLGWDSPLEHRIAMSAIGRSPAPVVGVVKDFHFRSLHEPIAPLLILVPTPEWMTEFVIRTAPGQFDEAIQHIEKVITEFDPNHPFTYRLFEDSFARLHQSDRQLGNVLTVAALIAIAIASLGLFGLAVFSAQRRTKEIGVRKTLGATSAGIVGLLSSEFLRLVIAANVIAIPVAYWVMSNWLQDFAYRMQLGPWPFLLAALLSFVIALLTVSSLAIRAAATNPVEALRYE